ncbi:receptor activity-modifying protein 1 isoform X1 [Rhinolophus ferrumequinum]|uniref:receptor activity-modifying protein 1 isoform X1 n=1 Tax=Rhinolophus ferrumequinum TaxID=59479 RepID=UPI00140FE2B3|nr:receptor activity-modifying protein 1 isoform X1 [Rhinolophus ferrumequinum]
MSISHVKMWPSRVTAEAACPVAVMTLFSVWCVPLSHVLCLVLDGTGPAETAPRSPPVCVCLASGWLSSYGVLHSVFQATAVNTSYGELTDCTRQVMEKLGCFWPNAAVDSFFVTVHQHYFRSCPVSGRAVRDPPSSVLCPFIVVPILVTLLVTALVVWRSKRTEGIV